MEVTGKLVKGVLLTLGLAVAAPSAMAAKIYGITAGDLLVVFNSKNPAAARAIGPMSGFEEQDSHLLGIDFRPQDGMLYGLGNGGGLYTINLSTAALTVVGHLGIQLTDASYDIDFMPVGNHRLRIIGDAGQSLRHNLDTDLDTIEDDRLRDLEGHIVTGINGFAFTNADSAEDTNSTAFTLNSEISEVGVNSPGTVVVAPTANLTVNLTGAIGFDIYSNKENGRAVNNMGFVSALVADGQARLYSVDPLTGVVKVLGIVPFNVEDISAKVFQD